MSQKLAFFPSTEVLFKLKVLPSSVTWCLSISYSHSFLEDVAVVAVVGATVDDGISRFLLHLPSALAFALAFS